MTTPAPPQEDEEQSGLTPRKDWTIFEADLSHHKEIARVPAAGFDRSSMNADAPWIVTDVDFGDVFKPHNSTFDVWVNGFDRNEVVQAKARASWALNNASDLGAALEKFGPESVPEIEENQKAYNNILEIVSIFGYAGKMRASGSETQSMGSLRWQRDGQRIVVIANVAEVAAYLKEEANPRIEEPITPDISACLKFADMATIAAFRARGNFLYHGQVKAKDPNSQSNRTLGQCQKCFK